MNITQTTQILGYDSLDKEIFLNILNTSNEVKKLLSKGNSILPGYDNFLFDIFLCFFKAEIISNEGYETKRGSKLYEMFINQIKNNEYIKYIRNDTFLDDKKSSVATVSFASMILDWLENNNTISGRTMSQLSDISEKEEIIDELQDEIETINQNKDKIEDKEKLSILDSIENDKKLDIKRIQNEIDELSDDIDSNIEDSAEQIDQFINSSLIDMDSKMTDYYSNSANIEDKINPDLGSESGQKIDLAHRLIENDKLRKLANMMGSLQDVMNSVRNKNWKTRSDEVYSINLGSDIGKTISSELMKLGNKHLKKEFYKKYLDQQLQQYHLKDRSTKGPYIICLDCSSSMSGDKEIWSKGIALTLAVTARKQKRKCDILAFTSSDFEVKHFDLKKRAFKSVDTEQFIDIAEYFPGGGTDFQKPLAKAVELLNDSKDRNADIVFITDGQSHINPGWLDEFIDNKNRLEFSVYSVLIDTTGDQHSDVLQKFSDKVTTIEELTDDNSKKIFLNSQK